MRNRKTPQTSCSACFKRRIKEAITLSVRARREELAFAQFLQCVASTPPDACDTATSGKRSGYKISNSEINSVP